MRDAASACPHHTVRGAQSISDTILLCYLLYAGFEYLAILVICYVCS